VSKIDNNIPLKKTLTKLIINQPFYLASWLVTPDQNKLNNSKKEIFIEPKLMHVLNYLCINAPEVISSDRLIEFCWPNQYFSDNPLHKCIAQLRKVLGDKAKQPEIIKTISKKGYAIIALIKGINSNSLSHKTSWLGKNPYLGLHHYKKEHSEIYFGRNKPISEVKSLFDNIKQADIPLLILEGSNGVGKSSLVNCQIIPSLLTPTHPYHYTFTETCFYDFEKRKDTQFLIQFIDDLTQMNVLGEGTKPKDLLSYISNTNNQLKINSITQYSGYYDNTKKVIFFIDHLEKIVSSKQNNIEEINAFFSLILQLINSGEYFFIFSIRTESYHNLNASFVFKRLVEESLRYRLLPPNIFEITEIIQKPVIAAGLSYEFNKTTFESLDTTLINDAVNISDILSILSHTLKELCENFNNKHQLTFETYKRIGGLKGAISYKVESIINKLNDQKKSIFNDTLYNFIHIDPDKYNGYVCVKVNINTFKNKTTLNLLHALLEEGLLVSDSSIEHTYISILHPSIIQESTFFQDWISTNYLKLSIITEIRTISNQWVFNQKDKNYLLKNTHLLGQVNTLANEENIKFDENQKQFLLQSNQQHKLKKQFKILFLFILCSLLIFSVLLLVENKKSKKQLVQINNKAENLITFMLGDLKEILLPLGKLELLEIIGSQVIEYYDDRTFKLQSEQSQLQYIRALNIIGEVEVNQGKLKSAEKYFRLSVQLDSSSFKNEETQLSTLYSNSQSNYWLGYINYIQNNYKVAEKHMFKYLEICNVLLEKQPSNELRKLEKSYALNSLGSLYYKQNDLLKAEKYFNGSVKLKREIVNNNPQNAKFLADLADTVSWQANILTNKHELLSSNQLYRDSLSLTQELTQLDQENMMWQHRLASAHYRVASNYYNLGELAKSMTNADQALSIYIKLNNFESSNQIWLKELINTHLLISKIFKNYKDFDNALLNIKRGKDLFNSYSTGSKSLKSANVQNLYLNAENSLIIMALGQYKTALEQFNFAVNNFKKIDTSKYTNENYIIAYSKFVLSKIHTANSNDTQSQNLLNEALALYKNTPVKTMSKNNIALYIAIKRMLNLESEMQEQIIYLNKINYKNPDFN
jgi:DNA-binding winged helix-turn-helix (wHTH) protein